MYLEIKKVALEEPGVTLYPTNVSDHPSCDLSNWPEGSRVPPFDAGMVRITFGDVVVVVVVDVRFKVAFTVATTGCASL